MNLLLQVWLVGARAIKPRWGAASVWVRMGNLDAASLVGRVVVLGEQWDVLSLYRLGLQ